MFHTMGRYWSSDKDRPTWRLFALEFLVVMAGVFAALALSDWLEHRRELAAVAEARAKADRDVASTSA